MFYYGKEELVLKKEVIANLNKEEMKKLKGGIENTGLQASCR